MDELERAKRLRRETVRQRISVIETDIDVGRTFLRIATSELDMGHRVRADELLAKAKVAYATTAKLLQDVTDAEDRQRLHDDHQAFADAIRALDGRKRRPEEENP